VWDLGPLFALLGKEVFMPKYIVLDMHIRHGKEGDKVATLYGPGVEIELTEEEAEKCAEHVVPVVKTKEKEEKEKKEKEEKTEETKPAKDKEKKSK
jgi:hypothetical protein